MLIIPNKDAVSRILHTIQTLKAPRALGYCKAGSAYSNLTLATNICLLTSNHSATATKPHPDGAVHQNFTTKPKTNESFNEKSLDGVSVTTPVSLTCDWPSIHQSQMCNLKSELATLAPKKPSLHVKHLQARFNSDAGTIIKKLW